MSQSQLLRVADLLTAHLQEAMFAQGAAERQVRALREALRQIQAELATSQGDAEEGGSFWDRVMSVSSGKPCRWAKQIGFSKMTVSSWKRGTRGPQAATLAKLVESTGIPAEWWLRGEGEIPPEAAQRLGLGAGWSGS